MNTSAILTKESNFSDLMGCEVRKMWQQRTNGEFLGVRNIPIRWISITKPEHDRCVVIVNGRNESHWKYQELFYELYSHGYDVYAYDHRGQGESGRILKDPQVGYVAEFDYYVDDLDTFIYDVVKPERYKNRYLLAHSMGGAVATLYLERKAKRVFNAAVLNAPMFGISLRFPLTKVASKVARFSELLQPVPSFFWGQKPYQDIPFEKNEQSQSVVRYYWYRHLYKEHPELRVGGPSPRWIWQAIEAANQCVLHANQISTPILLLQAGSDSIVDNHAHERFNSKTPCCRIHVIPGAKHELLMERDGLREQVLADTLRFFEHHNH
ncbi:TPA: alpha/beta fold hydrolase [Photobacterium damselae]